MATDLMLLLFEVNQLVSRVVRGDLTAAEVLAEKAGLLEKVCGEARGPVADTLPFDDLHEPADHRRLR